MIMTPTELFEKIKEFQMEFEKSVGIYFSLLRIIEEGSGKGVFKNPDFVYCFLSQMESHLNSFLDKNKEIYESNLQVISEIKGMMVANIKEQEL